MDFIGRIIFFLWDTTLFALQTLVTELFYVAKSPSSGQQTRLSRDSLQGKQMVLTGGSFGIGDAILRQWIQSGGSCVVLSRSKPAIQNSSETRIQWLPCDLASFDSVNAAIDKLSTQISSLDALICCAGTMMPDPALKSADGHDLSFQVNHLSHALLSLRLAPLMNGQSSAIFVSSVAHVAASGILGLSSLRSGTRGAPSTSPRGDKSSYSSASTAYAESKLANIVWANQLVHHLHQARAQADVPFVASLHPGVVHTALYRHMPPPFSWLQRALAPLVFRDPSEPAAEIVQLAAHCANAAPACDLDRQRGLYFVRGQPVEPAAIAEDKVLGTALWEYTCGALGMSSLAVANMLARNLPQ